MIIFSTNKISKKKILKILIAIITINCYISYDMERKNKKVKLEDTAQENLNFHNLRAIKSSLEEIMQTYYKETFELYVALTKDYIKPETKEPYLYYGQIGKVNFLPDEETCWVEFYDFDVDDPKLIHQLKLPIIDLLPLFFFQPSTYSKNIKKRRDEFYNCQFQLPQITTNFTFQQHSKTAKRFSINQLVTVESYFFEESRTGKIEVQAGQVGRISEILDNQLVKVSFRSLPLAILHLRIQKNSAELDSYFSKWSVEITIHKDYLFHLYYENLTQDKYYFDEFIQNYSGEEYRCFRKQFDDNYQRGLNGVIKNND